MFTQLFRGSTHCRGECSGIFPVVPAADSANVLEVLPGTSGSITADWTALDQGILKTSDLLKNLVCCCSCCERRTGTSSCVIEGACPHLWPLIFSCQSTSSSSATVTEEFCFMVWILKFPLKGLET